MAIYTTFFLCEPRELHPAFPGWQLPLKQPVTRTLVNPFTRQAMTVETREPEWADVDPIEMQLPEIAVVPIPGNYESYLQQRIPSFVQSQPHWCAKNLTSVELEPLIAVVTGSEEKGLEAALYAHPSLGAGIERFANEFVAHVKAADEAALTAIAQKWATEQDWTLDDVLSFLRPIVELAKKQVNAQSMFLLTEA